MGMARFGSHARAGGVSGKSGLRNGHADREVRERLGIFGVQLLSYVPVAGGFHRLRFIGHDEPGWCLRGIVTGPAASEPTGSDALRRLFFGTVVDVSADALRLPHDPEHRRLVKRETGGTARIIG